MLYKKNHSRRYGRIKMRDVVITGIGTITPMGIGKDELWNNVQCGKSGIGKIDCFDPSPFKSQIAGVVQNFNPRDYMNSKLARRLDRFSAFAVACSHMALEDAGLAIDHQDGERTGAYIGSALGGVAYAEKEHERYVQEGVERVNRLLALSVFTGAGACNVSIVLGLKGPSLSNANSCASGAIAVGEAFRLIQGGQVDVMLAGGAEAPLSPLCFGAFDLLKAMSCRNENPSAASRPFDAKRDGFVMSEGAAVFVLEEKSHAAARKAFIYGEVLGYGVTSDAHHMTIPRPDGSQAARSIQLALQEAQIDPSEIDYINAHGSSTPLNDKTETRAIKSIFGEEATKIPISATKSMHGHALGASGAIEIAIGLLAIQNNFIPPTINLDTPDPECDLDYVPHQGRSRSINKLLTQSFGFGGSNAALVLGKV